MLYDPVRNEWVVPPPDSSLPPPHSFPPPAPPPPLRLPPRVPIFRLAIYRYVLRRAREPNSDPFRPQLIIAYKSAWYPSRGEVRVLRAEIRACLEGLGVLQLISSFTRWRMEQAIGPSEAQWNEVVQREVQELRRARNEIGDRQQRLERLELLIGDLPPGAGVLPPAGVQNPMEGVQNPMEGEENPLELSDSRSESSDS